MTIRNVKDNLNLLDISSISQLDSNDIDYWWEEKYLSIKYDDSIPDDKKNNLLVSINKARDELNVIEIKIIKQILNKNQKEYPSDNNEYYPENNRNTIKSYLNDYWVQFTIAMILYRLIKYYSSN
tara:strand:- start:109 stop:483 length:375 start_codon:yes stop_codon:yes gene_type:complete